MSVEDEHARKLAERIARSVSNGPPPMRSTSSTSGSLSAELSSVRATLSDLQQKLAQIEAKVGRSDYDRKASSSVPLEPSAPATHSPWLGALNSLNHPSQEKFGIEEAAVSELVDFFQKEKTCSLEPGGKPCDHCDMCSSRGF
jgi:hypothetical protein